MIILVAGDLSSNIPHLPKLRLVLLRAATATTYPSSLSTIQLHSPDREYLRAILKAVHSLAILEVNSPFLSKATYYYEQLARNLESQIWTRIHHIFITEIVVHAANAGIDILALAPRSLKTQITLMPLAVSALKQNKQISYDNCQAD